MPVLATGHAATTKTQEEAKAPARKGGVKITNQQNNSGKHPPNVIELLRECRGLPNAGACRRYTLTECPSDLSTALARDHPDENMCT